MNLDFPNAELICRVKNPLDWSPEKTATMVAACRELAEFHYASNPDIRAIYDRHAFDPKSIREEADLARIPTLGVTAMKYHTIHTLPAEQTVLMLTSSGTRGQKTQIWFDEGSLDRCQAQLTGLWDQEGLISSEAVNYICFTYHPDEAKNLGNAFADKNQQRFAPCAEAFYTVRLREDGSWHFKMDESLAKLVEFAGSGRPTRIFGIPSFLHEMMLEMDRRGLRVKLAEGSFVSTGGGWKAAEDKAISRSEFREMVAERMGVPVEMFRDSYGMAEHCAPYIECRKHKFHIGAWVRVIARDPVTLRALPAGEPGLLELVTPFNAMMPNLALLTTDMGVVDTEDCGCGWKSPTFTLLGRGGLTKAKGCALSAADLVTRDVKR